MFQLLQGNIESGVNVNVIEGVRRADKNRKRSALDSSEGSAFEGSADESETSSEESSTEEVEEKKLLPATRKTVPRHRSERGRRDLESEGRASSKLKSKCERGRRDLESEGRASSKVAKH
jgi:hypothetical protein